MKELAIRAHYRKKWIATTIDSDFSSQLKNILKKDFQPEKPNRIWCSDITYIWTDQGFVYLSSIMDLYSIKIIAWDISDSLSVESVLKVVRQAREDDGKKKP